MTVQVLKFDPPRKMPEGFRSRAHDLLDDILDRWERNQDYVESFYSWLFENGSGEILIRLGERL